MHLNQLATFLPSFEKNQDWDPGSSIPRPNPHFPGTHVSRNLHRFVPLPADTRPPPSMSSHGELPSHFVINPEPHFHPTIHRKFHPHPHNPNRGHSYEEVILNPPSHMAEDLTHSHASAHPAPRAKQASRSTAPLSIASTNDPAPARSSKRPRSVNMVEHINRHGSPARDSGRENPLPAHPISYGPTRPSPPLLDFESDDPEPDRERAPSPTPTIPGHVPSTHTPGPVSTHSNPNPLDPAIADHRNRTWPPANDKTLIRWKMDSKSRPAWKTIAARMNRTPESCQARWQWLKNTNSSLLNPDLPDDNPAADD